MSESAPVEFAERTREVAFAIGRLLLGRSVRSRRRRRHGAQDAREQLAHEFAGERPAAARPAGRRRLCEVHLRLLEGGHELEDRVGRVALPLTQARRARRMTCLQLQSRAHGV